MVEQVSRRTHITPGMVVRRINTDDEWRTVDKVRTSSGRSRTVTFTDGTSETVGTGTPWEVQEKR